MCCKFFRVESTFNLDFSVDCNSILNKHVAHLVDFGVFLEVENFMFIIKPPLHDTSNFVLSSVVWDSARFLYREGSLQRDHRGGHW